MRVIDLGALQNMFSLEPEEFPIILITLTRGADTIRLSSDATERISEDPIVYGTMSRTNPYVYFPFELTLPQDQAETVPRMRLSVENVSAQIGWWLRSSTTAPAATVEIVSSGDVDAPIASFPDFELTSFRGGKMTVEGNLSLSNLENEPYPAGSFNPAYFPGLF